jgi:trans-aconitate 2-methyltransferase
MNQDGWNPNQYDKFKDERSQPFYDLVELIRPSKLQNVVDLGCGTGELTAVLHKKLSAAKTLGLDSSGEMLKKAEHLSGNGLSFQTEDINSWKNENTFDLVFSNAALQWCDNHASLFEKIKHSLKPHGQIAIQMPMNHDYPTHVLANQMSQEQPWAEKLNTSYQKQQTMLSPEEYACLLFRLGFNEQKVLLKVYGHVLESREGVVEWVKGTLLTYFKSRLSDSDYSVFLDEFRARLFEQLPNDKPFFYPFKRILLWAAL